MSDVDAAKIAERLRFLLKASLENDAEALPAAANRLNVDEFSLLASIDEHRPQPALHVIMAFIRVYGIDPAWLVTGVYSGSVHRTAMEANPASIRNTVAQMLAPAEASGPQ